MRRGQRTSGGHSHGNESISADRAFGYDGQNQSQQNQEPKGMAPAGIEPSLRDALHDPDGQGQQGRLPGHFPDPAEEHFQGRHHFLPFFFSSRIWRRSSISVSDNLVFRTNSTK